MKEAKFTCSGIALDFRLLGGGVVPRGSQTGSLQLYFGSRGGDGRADGLPDAGSFLLTMPQGWSASGS